MRMKKWKASRDGPCLPPYRLNILLILDSLIPPKTFPISFSVKPDFFHKLSYHFIAYALFKIHSSIERFLSDRIDNKIIFILHSF